MLEDKVEQMKNNLYYEEHNSNNIKENSTRNNTSIELNI
jgi:hypothetical protein